MNVICLVVDRLHAGYLGCYGNTWIQTPTFDRLAGESVVFDHVLIDSPELDALYRSLWLGQHPVELGSMPDSGRKSLPRLARDAGFQTRLVTDDGSVAGHALASDFEEVDFLESTQGAPVAASVEAETGVAEFFAASSDALHRLTPPFFAWLHLGNLGAIWDAPLEFRNQYADEDDPDPPTIVLPPRRVLPPDFDPDELLGICQAYAGQVTLLDRCIEGWLESLTAIWDQGQTLLVVASARGFPLGEHGRIGPHDDCLDGELVQVPLMIRFPDGTGAAARVGAIVQPGDLAPTLVEWLNLGKGMPSGPASPGLAKSLLPLARGEVDVLHERECVVAGPNCIGLRTTEWYWQQSSAGRDGAGQLFAKPEDRWEVNDVADRCSDVAESMARGIRLETSGPGREEEG